MSSDHPSTTFLASGRTFGQRLDQVLQDAQERLGASIVQPVVYTQCPARPGCAGPPELGGDPAGLCGMPADIPALRPLSPEAGAVVVVAVSAAARVAVYWDWRYAYTYSDVSISSPEAAYPLSLGEELALHSLPSAATVMDDFADQVIDLAPPAA